jgi:hypothetical protein
MARSARVLALGAVGTICVSWAVSACLSPTLPLPPPGEPEVAELNADGQTVRIVGHGAIQGATVNLYNDDTQDGLWTLAAGAEGTYTFLRVPVDLSHKATNDIEIWQTYGADSSQPFVVHVPKGVPFGAVPPDDASASAQGDAGASDAHGADAGE